MSITFNKVILAGYVTDKPKLPQIKYFPSGEVMAMFYVEQVVKKKNADGNYYNEFEQHRIQAWKNKIHDIETIAMPDNLVFISGTIRNDKLTDKRSGNVFMYSQIIAEEMHLVSKRTKDEKKNLDRD